ncbi:MAG TPA: hypothetical protein PLV13_03565 [Ilumatobacteraceae bacterium]|nr:hypothetical protein [Ilumatobacteraceae bacterium]
METEGGSRDIVRCFGAVRTIDRAEEQRQQWRSEHLAIPGTGHIHFVALPSEDPLSDQLARRVAQDPSDARLHVARVNHHVIAEDAEQTYAALVDVFFAFGESGRGLRERLLNGARRVIGPHRAALLDPFVATGMLPSTSLPLCPGSMLSNGVTGETDIVRLSSGAL